MAMKIVPRDYQDALIGGVRVSLRSHQAVIAVLSTGGGKTVVFSCISQSASEGGVRVLILVHRDELLRQTCDKLASFGVRFGIIAAGYTPDAAARVQVASVQTIVRRLGKFPMEFQLIVIDEAHLSIAPTYQRVIAAFPTAKLLGVTATPQRLDGKGLGRKFGGLYDDMVCGISLGELTSRGYLVPCRVFGPLEKLDLEKVKTTAGEYDSKELAAAVDKPTITGSAVEHYRKFAHGRPAMGFCVNIEHAKHTAEAFRAAGYRAVAVSGESTAEERRDAVEGLGSGKYDQVFNAQLYIEGLDCPAIGCIIDLAPTRSVTRFLQKIGRGLRPHPGKVDCIYLDHAAACFSHGMPNEEREWTLEGRKKRKKKAKGAGINVVQCKKCYSVYEGGPPECPFCGHVDPKNARKGPEHVDGQLGEITPEMAAAMMARRKAEIRQATTLEQLQELGEQFGYEPGWAHRMNKLKNKHKRPPAPPPPSLDDYAPGRAFNWG